jgi:hypothetical protein
MKIPEYIKDNEVDCGCGCGLVPNKTFMKKLYIWRLLQNKPRRFLSGSRCRPYNKLKGGSGDSAHIRGAVDVYIPTGQMGKAVSDAIKAGMTGIGIKSNRKSIHLDDKHKELTIWSYE